MLNMRTIVYDPAKILIAIEDFLNIGLGFSIWVGISSVLSILRKG